MAGYWIVSDEKDGGVNMVVREGSGGSGDSGDDEGGIVAVTLDGGNEREGADANEEVGNVDKWVV